MTLVQGYTGQGGKDVIVSLAFDNDILIQINQIFNYNFSVFISVFV
jgi:hypothetical protein